MPASTDQLIDRVTLVVKPTDEVDPLDPRPGWAPRKVWQHWLSCQPPRLGTAEQARLDVSRVLRPSTLTDPMDEDLSPFLISRCYDWRVPASSRPCVGSGTISGWGPRAGEWLHRHVCHGVVALSHLDHTVSPALGFFVIGYHTLLWWCLVSTELFVQLFPPYKSWPKVEFSAPRSTPECTFHRYVITIKLLNTQVKTLCNHSWSSSIGEGRSKSGFLTLPFSTPKEFILHRFSAEDPTLCSEVFSEAMLTSHWPAQSVILLLCLGM